MALNTNPQTTALPTNRVRIAGAGFTLFTFGGQPITFCQEVAHTSPRLVAQPSPIQPMDEPYPVEILVPPAAGPGQLVLNMFELFGSNGNASKVWDRLGASVGGATFGGGGENSVSTLLSGVGSTNIFTGAKDIVDLVIRQSQVTPDKMQIVKIIRPLSTTGIQDGSYTDEYNGCVITDVVDGERVSVGTVEIIKQITVAYRYVTRNGVPSAAFKVRDGQLNNVVP